MNTPEPLPEVTARMARAARALLDALSPPERAAATAPFDAPDHREWRYLPGARPGLRLGDLDPERRDLALALLDTGCGEAAGPTARAIIELDRIRRQLAGREVADGDHNFWVRVFGAAGGPGPWAWRMNGHHLAVHATIVGDRLAVTPNFFGTEPAIVAEGPHRGLRVLPDEEELARALLERLDDGQLAVAVAAAVAPDDILTRTDPVADPAAVPGGLRYEAMDGGQRELLHRLVRRYFDRAPDAHARSVWGEAEAAGLETVRFAWCGPVGRGHGHYYAVTGPTFLLEYDNTQDDANHIHSVWRDLRHDWGHDLLAEHYLAEHQAHVPH